MPDITIPKPTSSHILWGGAVEIHCFGRPQNWSLAGKTALAAEMNNPGIRYRMHQMAERYGLERIYAPNPSKFNGVVAHMEEFDVEWADERVLRGPFADGVLLTEPNTAFAVSSADCPTVVHHEPTTGLVTAAHAGLESLHMADGKDSVIENVISAMRKALGANYGLYQPSFIACGIGKGAYFFDPNHPRFTEKHGELCRSAGRLFLGSVEEIGGLNFVDLAELIRLQYMTIGFDKSLVGTDGACTARDKGRNGQPLWHSNRRGDKTRNLVLVIRR